MKTGKVRMLSKQVNAFFNVSIREVVMPTFAGSLLDNIQRVLGEGDIVGVVVVDEQGDPPTTPYPQTIHQQLILAFAARLELPVWLVELNPNPGNRPNIRTRTQLRALLRPNNPVITKSGLNAFHRTNLDSCLRRAHVDTILLMGFATNMCVRLTATGGYTGRGNTGELTRGAIQLGYTVMTCPQILRGGEASWNMLPGIESYSTP